MTKKIAFIDPFVETPAIHCFNDFVSTVKSSVTYHMPSRFGQTSLEDAASETRAYIVVGSASHVTEPLEWHAPLAQFLLAELKKNKPVIACCFGHQLLCHALGSQVDYALENQEKYLGLREVTITENFWNYKKGEVFNLPVSHKQVVKTLGKGLKSVGHGLFHDIIIHEEWPLLATQTHPEASKHFFSTIPGPHNHDGQLFIQRFLQYYKI